MSNKAGAVVKQASFLMIAGLLCRVIGLLYRSPLSGIIGNTGAAYYTYANEWYSILLLISAYSIPSAISKVMSERLALKRYKDAQRVFYAGLFYAVVVAGIAAVLCYVLAPILLKNTPGAVLALRVLAPTVLLSGVLGVMRGFFQARSTMMPTSISQILEQIAHAIVSIVAAYFLINLVTSNFDKAELGAAGGTLGTGAGVLVALLFMVILYVRNHKNLKGQIKSDTFGNTESYKEVIKVILLMVTPVIFSTCVYNVSGVVNQTIYSYISAFKGVDPIKATELYGAYGYYCKPIINIPVALGSASATAIIPAVAAHFALNERQDAIDRINECIKFTMFIAIPAAVGLAVLSVPVMRMLYPSSDYLMEGAILSMSAISVVFYCLSSVTNGVLQGLGKPRLPVIHAAIALLVNVVSLVIFMLLGMGVIAVVLSAIIYSVTVCILNAKSIKEILGYSPNKKKCYYYPTGAAVIMGMVVGIIYWIPKWLLADMFAGYMMNAILTVVAVGIGVIVYLLTYLSVSKMTDEEIKALPMGRKILKVVKYLPIKR